jgi:hypothetical protein
VSAPLWSLDAIGFRACALLREHGVSLAVRVGLPVGIAEITVTDEESAWTCGAWDLATAVQMAAQRLGHADVVRWIDDARATLRRAPTLRPEGEAREVRTG